jgi:NADPH2:quinone reductase
VPEDVDFSTGAATMLQAMTAHFLTFGITQLNPGDRALVHGGAGGVGLLLIQMLKKVGAYVFTTVSTEAKAVLAKDAGADTAIIYTQQDFAEVVKKATDGQGVRIVYDAVGKTTFDQSIKCWDARDIWRCTARPAGQCRPLSLECCATAPCS